jgi:hypothetical protein
MPGARFGRVYFKTYLFVGSMIGAWFSLPDSIQGALSFIGNAYVELQPSGNANKYYWVNNSDGSNLQFSGNLGGLQIVQGQSLLLGGQAQTYQPQFGVSVTMHYAIDQNTTFSAFNLAYNGSQGNNDRWDTSGAVNIDNNLSAGTHTLYVWYSAYDGSSTTVYDNAGGVNFSANFTVTAVPEPVTLALPIFGGLLVTAGLSRRVLSRLGSRAN